MSFGEHWGSVSVDQDGQGEAPEPGVYDVTLDDAKAFTSKGGKDVLVFEFRVVSGQAMGHRWDEFYAFNNAARTKTAKSVCSRMGVPIDEVASLPELDAEVKRLIGGYFEIEVVQNGEYRNVFVQGRATPSSDLPAQSDPVAVAQMTPESGDDVPW